MVIFVKKHLSDKGPIHWRLLKKRHHSRDVRDIGGAPPRLHQQDRVSRRSQPAGS